MRDRTIRKQVVTIRPLSDHGTKNVDEFGDAPLVMPDNRDDSFNMKAQVTWSNGMPYEPGDNPGRNRSFSTQIMIRRRDVPPTAPDRYKTGIGPDTNDIFELVSGRKLFVADIQPAWPRRVSVGSPRGGWDGWRVTLTDRQPTASAASQYE